MFKLTKSPTFWMTVSGDEQAESGRRAEFKFDLQVKRITFPELSALLKAAAEDGRSDFEAVNVEGTNLYDITVTFVGLSKGKPV